MTPDVEQTAEQNVAPPHVELRFGVLLALMVVLYALLAWQFWLPYWIPKARVTIGTVTDRSLSGAGLLALTGTTLYVLYIAGAVVLWRWSQLRRADSLVWGGALLSVGILLLAYPVTSTDVFDYIFRSRMAFIYGANPYLALPNQFKQDPFFSYVGWPNAPSAYGPLWENVSWTLSWIGGSSVLRTVLLYKGLAIAAYVLCAELINRLVRHPQRKLLGVYLWLWSPLALWEFAAVGHNDGFLALSLLGALWGVRHERYWLAVLALIAGALFKFLPVIFIPLVALRWMQQQSSWYRRGLVVGAVFVLCAVPTVVLYAPYWDLPSSFGQLSFGQQIQAIWNGGETTLRNVSVRSNLLHAAPMAVISYLLQQPASLETINTILSQAASARAKAEDVRTAVSSFESVLLVVGLLWQSWHVWFRQRDLHSAFWGLLLWYLLCASQWFHSWYLLWPLALLAIRPERRSFAWLTAWALMAQASYLLQFIILPNLRIKGPSLEAQTYYVLLIYPLPLLVWLLMTKHWQGGANWRGWTRRLWQPAR